jgi:hypothetical protein
MSKIRVVLCLLSSLVNLARHILRHLRRRPNPPTAMLLRWTEMLPGCQNSNIKIIIHRFEKASSPADDFSLSLPLCFHVYGRNLDS